MRVLFDTNIVLDFLLARAPHDREACLLFDLLERRKLEGLLCATTLTTIHYLASKRVGRTKAQKSIRELMDLFEIAPVGRDVLDRALGLGFSDYEDAVLHEAARAVKASSLVTRNRQHFASATLTVFDPRELLAVLEAHK